MKDIAIYGAGGLGREVKWLIDEINKEKPTWNFIGFFDDGVKKENLNSKYGKVLGGIKDVNAWAAPLDVVLAFGKPATISLIRSKIINTKITFPNIIAPTVSISNKETFSIGEGNIIASACSFSIDNRIGSFNLFNGHTATGHDVEIGNCNVIMPGARISGEVFIGNENLIGADSFIVQGLRIGNNVTLSPLSALLTKPKEGKTYIGNPAKVFKF